MKAGQLVLIELNEINFDVVKRYVDEGHLSLPALQHLMRGHRIRTTSEDSYERLEPWIQWPSVHSGRSFDEHQVFRLGDMTAASVPQMFELLEQRGLKVGAISAMNAVNRMRLPSYFIPDPWTRTPSDGSLWSKVLTTAISQVVNDNAEGRITLSSALWLALGIVRFARPRNYLTYLRLALGAIRAPWRKALFLDLFLHDLHLRLFRRRSPDFTTIFVNAGAHIQHHYFLNAAPLKQATSLKNPEWYVSPGADPVAEMLNVYDRIVADYLRLPGIELILATGLSQRPYDRVKFYYRLKDHAEFLRLIGIRYSAVLPRMTRDFLVEFDSQEDAVKAEAMLSRLVISGGKGRLFGEIDNRGVSLFVTLTYPDEIFSETEIEIDGVRFRLLPHVAFVAIKNGMHQGEGFAFFEGSIAGLAPADRSHVKCLYSTIMGYFDSRQHSSAIS